VDVKVEVAVDVVRAEFAKVRLICQLLARELSVATTKAYFVPNNIVGSSDTPEPSDHG
jgi:hypothetical protein